MSAFGCLSYSYVRITDFGKAQDINIYLIIKIIVIGGTCEYPQPGQQSL